MKLVKRITVVDGEGRATTLYRTKKKEKLSAWARPLARAEKALLAAQETFFAEARARQTESSRKRRNGFLRDGAMNYTEANQKAWRVLLRKVLG